MWWSGYRTQRLRTVSLKFPSVRSLLKHSKRLAKNSSASKDCLPSDLRPALHVCHKTERRRRSRRVGDSDASSERCASLQEIFSNEAANEKRGPGKTQPPSHKLCLLVPIERFEGLVPDTELHVGSHFKAGTNLRGKRVSW